MAESERRARPVAHAEARARFFSNWAPTGSAMAVGGLIVILGLAATVAESSRTHPLYAVLYTVFGIAVAMFVAGALIFWAAMTERKLPGQRRYQFAEMQGYIVIQALSRFQQLGHSLAVSDGLTQVVAQEWRHHLMMFIDQAWGEQESDALFPTQNIASPNDALSAMLEELKSLSRRCLTYPVKSTFPESPTDVANWMAYLQSNFPPETDDE